MSNLIASLKSGNWRSLLACFLYFDTGFTVWVLYGPLALFICKDVTMTAAQQGFLVAVPVLAAEILRVTLGNLYQSTDGRRIALMGVVLSSIPSIVLSLTTGVPSYPMLLVLGVSLGMGGASFAIALPMAGSNYPPKVQCLVLGLAAAGNIGAVLDGFLFPHLADAFGWQLSTAAARPLLAITAVALYAWASDAGEKTGSTWRALSSFAVTLASLIVLVLAVYGGVFGTGKAGVLLLPVLGALIAIAVLLARYRAMLGERDTWVVMLDLQHHLRRLRRHVLVRDAAADLALSDAEARSRPLHVVARVPRRDRAAVLRLRRGSGDGRRALLVLLAAIAVGDFAFAIWMPPVAGRLAILVCLYVAFGLGNGSTFQLVPHRWKSKTGLLSGIVGAASGIGGFYLPVIMGIAKENTGSYQMGFATFGVLATCAFGALFMLRGQWLRWSSASAPRDGVAIGGTHAME